MVAAREERLAGRGAERRGVEAVVLQTARSQARSGRRGARAAECTRGGEADVVEQDDEDVRRSRRRPQRLDRRKRAAGSFASRAVEGSGVGSEIGRTERSMSLIVLVLLTAGG